MSDKRYLSIGEVLALLQDEFPDITISKIRFLESQGLIDPERTPSGYRKFYDGDIERLRFILREQKEHFLPLRIIKDRLENGQVVEAVSASAAGHPAAAGGVAAAAAAPTSLTAAPTPTAVPAPSTAAPAAPAGPGAAPIPTPVRPGAPTAAGGSPSTAAPDVAITSISPGSTGASFTLDELASASGLRPEQVREIESFGLLAPRVVGRDTYYDEEALITATAVAGFLRHGLEPRHLRLYKNAAEREAGLFEQVVLPLVKQRNPKARADAVERLADLARLGRELQQSLLRQALRPYADG